ncbi:hypothetical protein [Coxiella burnetii]|uniref:Uncharacterized protein n=4 Tax=Coxiella burnetii TaxID=777 RepID=Q83AS4_COXBU|nr:hypothetical protein [Coxiella burnetii]NP_820785.1 hypothetical protein CBU_1806 [Coxiella burnetii RSA 493]AAO91299.1 hypothetical protein CBU_1806 [Coxiella burnetii RSA 493]ABS76491.1 hypothetical protein CBUD_0035 [Coxiella burnetii Dugway 5J108-111]ABX78273.1 conserved domain protein [Coxiella burnetii RSA 331]AML48299.1 DNA polymerase [Coxiella burnetii]AML54313.1 DNA polymerase [Coxiella burnetii]
MPYLVERQEQYLRYLEKFSNDISNETIDSNLLEEFKKALTASVRDNNKHLLKRMKGQGFLFWKKDDVFSNTAPTIERLETILTPSIQNRPSRPST